MRKILLFIFIIGFPFALSAQWYGDGSEEDAFWGVINSSYPLTTDLEWNTTNFPGGVIYVGQSGSEENDLVIGSGYTLTIGPGITVIFTQLTSDLLITGSGVLTAEGTSSDQILFTKDSGKSHWGHISFETPGSGTPIAGTGTFEYCTVQYGYAATSGTYPSNAGGGIQVNANGVTIENCYFENNYSNFGGAVTVNAGRNTEIKNCVFKSNTSNQAGGALLLWTSSTAKVENCIFEKNNSLSNGGNAYGGGGIWILANTSTIVNCTFVNNTAIDPGDGIYSYGSSGSRIINCILWGSSDQFAGASTTSTIVTCAFESAKPANAITSIIISDVADDHFTDAGSGDWSIKFISPCRDAGTNSYGSPNIVPSLDYDGNPRIGTKDIGTYEVQYSRWTGATSTTWSTVTNWDASIDPDNGTGDVYFPTGLSRYPNVSTSQDYTIGDSKFMIVEPGAQVTLDVLTNYGTLELKSDATKMFSLLFNSFPGSGTVKSEIYFTGGENPPSEPNRWHYMAVPQTMSKTVMTNINPYNLLRYDDSRVTTDKFQGWQWHDGWDGSYPQPSDEFYTLDEKRGYNFFRKTTDASTAVLTSTSLLSGLGTIYLQFNTGIDVPLAGWNLLGNSLTCSLDWEAVDWSGGVYVRNAVYYTINDALAGYVDGDGVNDGTQFIPPLQGFFVKTDAASQSIGFSPAKVHSGQSYYKGKGSVTPQVRLEIWQGNRNDETVIRFKDESTSLFDGKFDASKWVSQTGIAQIYTHLTPEDYCINTIPFPEIKTDIPVYIVIPADGTYSIKRTIITGLDNYTVFLKDIQQNYTVNLNEVTDYTFNAIQGTIENRFILTVSNVSTDIPDNTFNNKLFNIFSTDNIINIQTMNNGWDGRIGSVKVFDLAGKTVTEQKNIEFWKNSINQIPTFNLMGIYLVEIQAGAMRYVGKVIVK